MCLLWILKHGGVRLGSESPTLHQTKKPRTAVLGFFLS